MASTLFIALPARHVLQSDADWNSVQMPYACLSDEGKVLQHGAQAFMQMQTQATAARRLVLLLAASDVSLLTVSVPPMPAAKLRMALPNLLEDQLIGDPAESVMVAGAVVEGKVAVAVSDRHWLEKTAAKLRTWSLRSVHAYPAQLALPCAPDHLSALAERRDDGLMLSLRAGAQSGGGLQLDQWEDVLQSASMMAAGQSLTLLVPAAQQAECQQALQSLQVAAQPSITVQALDWPARVAGLNAATPDLMSAVAGAQRSRFEWKTWRTPVYVALAVVVLNLLALNADWLMQKREADNLKNLMLQTFRSTYPKATVLMPLDQMRQNVNTSRRLAGQFAADDFAVMAAQFSQVWDRVMAGKPANMAVLEYKEHALHVKPKSVTAVPVDELRRALAEQSMKMDVGPDGVLHISAGGKP